MRFANAIVLAFVLLMLLLPSASAARPVIYATWTSTPPTIDGVFTPGEWSSPQIRFEAPTYPESYVLPTYAYFVYDESNLYVMVDAVGDKTDDEMDECLLWFNFDEDTLWVKVIVDITGAAGKEVTTPFHGVVGFGTSDNSQDQHKIYEFSVPLTLLEAEPGEAIDFCSPMEKYGSSMPYDPSHDDTPSRDNVWPLGLSSPPSDRSEWGQLVLGSPSPVGGIVTPLNTFAILVPWLAVIGLAGCAATVVVVAKKEKLLSAVT